MAWDLSVMEVMTRTNLGRAVLNVVGTSRAQSSGSASKVAVYS